MQFISEYETGKPSAYPYYMDFSSFSELDSEDLQVSSNNDSYSNDTSK